MSYAEVLGKWQSAEHELDGRQENDDKWSIELNLLGFSGHVPVALEQIKSLRAENDKLKEAAVIREEIDKKLKEEIEKLKEAAGIREEIDKKLKEEIEKLKEAAGIREEIDKLKEEIEKLKD